MAVHENRKIIRRYAAHVGPINRINSNVKIFMKLRTDSHYSLWTFRVASRDAVSVAIRTVVYQGKSTVACQTRR